MSGGGILLDSVVLIDHLNGIEAATDYLRGVGRAAHISAISRAEVLAGLDGEARRAAARFMDCMQFLPIDRDIADLAADLRRRHRWKLPDAFQAAVALHHNLQLATRDTAGFDPKRHAFVFVPYVV
jgi:hypothetical protein